MNGNERNGHSAFLVRSIFVYVIILTLFTGCYSDDENLHTKPETNVDFQKLLAYRNQDLRLKESEVRENVGLRVGRLRENEYWPAFILEMNKQNGETCLIYIESPPIPESEPPREKINITIFLNKRAITPAGLREYYVAGILQKASIVQYPLGNDAADLLKLEVARRDSEVNAFYALAGKGSDVHLVFLRAEVHGRLCNNLSPCWFDERTKWNAIKSDWSQFDDPARLPDLLSALLYMAFVSKEEKMFKKNEINDSLELLRKNDKFKKLASHENGWVRNYVYLICARDLILDD
jgi:hypothetical protein